MGTRKYEASDELEKIYQAKAILATTESGVPTDLLERIEKLEIEILNARLKDFNIAANKLFEGIDSPYVATVKNNSKLGVIASIKTHESNKPPQKKTTEIEQNLECPSSSDDSNNDISPLKENHNSNIYLFSKKVDKSFMTRGFTLAIKCYGHIRKIIGKNLLKGDNETIRVNLFGTLYEARLNNVSFKNYDKECYQIYWKNLKNMLPVLNRFSINEEIAIYGVKNKSIFIIKKVNQSEEQNSDNETEQILPSSETAEKVINKELENNNPSIDFRKSKNGYFISRFKLNTNKLRAFAYYDGKKVLVKKGSEVNRSHYNNCPDLKQRERYLRNKSHEEAGKMILDEDIPFNSPNAASSFCLGKASNGLVDWVDKKNNPLQVYFEKANYVDGIWAAYKSPKFRSLFERHLFKKGTSDDKVKRGMQLFENKIIEVEKDVTFNAMLNKSKEFDEISSIFSRIFETWENDTNHNYKFYKDIFNRYLMLLKDYHKKNGNLIEPQ